MEVSRRVKIIYLAIILLIICLLVCRVILKVDIISKNSPNISRNSPQLIALNEYDKEPFILGFSQKSDIIQINFSKKTEWSSQFIIFDVYPKSSLQIRLGVVEEDGDEYWIPHSFFLPNEMGSKVKIYLNKTKIDANLSKGDGKKLQYITKCLIKLVRLDNKSKQEITIKSIVAGNPIWNYREHQEPIYPINHCRCEDIMTYCLREKYSQLFDGNNYKQVNTTEIITNTAGLRDYEYRIKKPNGTFRIAAIGDSFTFGEGVNIKETWVKQLETKLNELYKKKKVEVINFGVSGYSVKEEKLIYKYRAKKYQPDLVIVFVIGNDFYNQTKFELIADKVSKTIDNKKNRREILIGAMNLAYQELEKLDAKQKFYLVNKSYEPFFSETRVNEIKGIFIFHWELQSWYAEALKILAEKNNWDYVDLRELSGMFQRENLVIPDDGHPNERGHRLIAESIFKKVLSQIE